MLSCCHGVVVVVGLASSAVSRLPYAGETCVHFCGVCCVTLACACDFPYHNPRGEGFIINCTVNSSTGQWGFASSPARLVKDWELYPALEQFMINMAALPVPPALVDWSTCFPSVLVDHDFSNDMQFDVLQKAAPVFLTVTCGIYLALNRTESIWVRSAYLTDELAAGVSKIVGACFVLVLLPHLGTIVAKPDEQDDALAVLTSRKTALETCIGNVAASTTARRGLLKAFPPSFDVDNLLAAAAAEVRGQAVAIVGETVSKYEAIAKRAIGAGSDGVLHTLVDDVSKTPITKSFANELFQKLMKAEVKVFVNTYTEFTTADANLKAVREHSEGEAVLAQGQELGEKLDKIQETTMTSLVRCRRTYFTVQAMVALWRALKQGVPGVPAETRSAVVTAFQKMLPAETVPPAIQVLLQRAITGLTAWMPDESNVAAA